MAWPGTWLACALLGGGSLVARADSAPAAPTAPTAPTAATAATAATTTATAARHPVLVELFTSQGCFTCPPADELLGRLGRESGGRVIPLAFHVDSWNSLGWSDPYSSATWTRRHEAYARALGAESPYTPQAVVAGGAQMVGSQQAELLAAIAAAAAQPAAEIRLELAVGDDQVAARIDVALPEPLRGQKWDLLVAVYETDLTTAVAAGENRGRQLRNDYVVRSLQRVARLDRAAPAGSEHAARLRLARKWNGSRLGVVAFLQDPETLRIGGVVARGLAES